MRSLRAQRTQQAAMALEREKAEKYALVQHALADAVSHTLLVPNSNAAAADTDEESQRAAVEVLRQHWRTLQQAATVVGSLAWDLKPFCAAPPVWQSEITIALRVSIRRLGGSTNDTQAKLKQGSAAAGVSLVGSPRGDEESRSVSGVTVRDLCSQSQACVRVTHRELGRIENLLAELHRLLVLLANGLPCPGLDGRVKIEKPQDVAVVPLELEGRAQSHRERVTDNVPTTIPLEYNGHYTVLGKVDVTVGMEPNTKIVGYFFFGTLEVIGSAQSVLCPQLKRLQTSKGWVTWRPTLLQKMEFSTTWAHPEPEPEPEPKPHARGSDGSTDGTSVCDAAEQIETQEQVEALLQADLDREEEALIRSEMDGLDSDIVYNPAFLPTPDASSARLHESDEPTFGVTVQGRSSELLLQMCDIQLKIADPVAQLEALGSDMEFYAEIDYSSIRNWQYDRDCEVLSIEVADARSIDTEEVGVVHRFGTSDGVEIVRLLEDRKGVPQSPAPLPLPQEYIAKMPKMSSTDNHSTSRLVSPTQTSGVACSSRASEGSIGDYSDSGDHMLSPVSLVSGEPLSLPSTIEDFDDQLQATSGDAGTGNGADAAGDAVQELPAAQQHTFSRSAGQAAPKTLAAPEMVQQLQAAAALALAEPRLGEAGDSLQSLTSLRGPSTPGTKPTTTSSEQQQQQASDEMTAAAPGDVPEGVPPAGKLYSEAKLMPSGVAAAGLVASGSAGSIHHEMVAVVVRMMDRVQATRKSLQVHI